MPNKNPLASIILPCKNEGSNIKNTLDSILSTTTTVKYEIIVVDDASQDGCVEKIKDSLNYRTVQFFTTEGLGSAKARNFGAQQARGKYLVFCDAHIFVEAFWLDKLLVSFKTPGVDAVSPAIAAHDNPVAIGYGQILNEKVEAKWITTNPRKITHVPLLPGGCVAYPKDVFEQVGGFNEGFQVWGYEDIEISYRTWIMGFTCAVNPNVKVIHIFRKSHPYKVTMDDYYFNLLHMAFVHFKPERISKVVEQIKKYGHFSKILVDVMFSDAWRQRSKYKQIRKHDDDWFMETFKVNL
ncbi:glycosyltransferase [Bacillota bacterium LX-D]|nr:glycosyltransferase [Bacillota bacterium LX-D]